MQVYRSKYGKLPGTSYAELIRAARQEYHTIQKLTPRRVPYVRSQYFSKDKVFLNTFWEHLKQKRSIEQVNRLKYYKCAIDLLRNTTFSPESVFEKNNPGVLLHRFSGQTSDGASFFVQVKDNRRTGRKEFMSVFPTNQSRK
jgi:hypothetical protein